jgi:hypothetical protein
MHQLAEVRVPVRVTLEYPAHQAQYFQAVADGDVGDQAALGGHDRGDPADRPGGHGALRDRLAQALQPGEPRRVASTGHLGGQVTAGGGQQEGQAWAKHVTGDQQDHARAKTGHLRPVIVDDRVTALEPPGGHGAPVLGVLGPAGCPLVLPGVARQGLQPCQDLDHAGLPVGLAGGIAQPERRLEQPVQHLLSRLPGNRPGLRHRAGREPGQQRRQVAPSSCRKAPPGRDWPRPGMGLRPRRRDHGPGLPKRISSDSGLYRSAAASIPGAPGDGAWPSARRA